MLRVGNYSLCAKGFYAKEKFCCSMGTSRSRDLVAVCNIVRWSQLVNLCKFSLFLAFLSGVIMPGLYTEDSFKDV